MKQILSILALMTLVSCGPGGGGAEALVNLCSEGSTWDTATGSCVSQEVNDERSEFLQLIAGLKDREIAALKEGHTTQGLDSGSHLNFNDDDIMAFADSEEAVVTDWLDGGILLTRIIINLPTSVHFELDGKTVDQFEMVFEGSENVYTVSTFSFKNATGGHSQTIYRFSGPSDITPAEFGIVEEGEDYNVSAWNNEKGTLLKLTYLEELIANSEEE